MCTGENKLYMYTHARELNELLQQFSKKLENFKTTDANLNIKEFIDFQKLSQDFKPKDGSVDVVSDLETQLKLINFAEYFFSENMPFKSVSEANSVKKHCIIDYLKTGKKNSTYESDIISFLKFCKQNPTDPLLNLSSNHLDQIGKLLDNLEFNIVDNQQDYKLQRESLLETLGISNNEYYYRGQAVKFDYHQDPVKNLVEGLFDQKIISKDQSQIDIVHTVHKYIQKNFNYEFEKRNEDNWKTVSQTLLNKKGDCEDLAILLTTVLSHIFHNYLGFSKSYVANNITMVAGKMGLKPGVEVGHALTKITIKDEFGSQDEFYLDATGKSNMILAKCFNYNEYFEINDVVFKKYQFIDSTFRTAALNTPLFDWNLKNKELYGLQKEINQAGSEYENPLYKFAIRNLNVTENDLKEAYSENQNQLIWYINNAVMEINRIASQSIAIPKQFEGALYREISDLNELDFRLGGAIDIEDENSPEAVALKKQLDDSMAIQEALDELQQTITDKEDEILNNTTFNRLNRNVESAFDDVESESQKMERPLSGFSSLSEQPDISDAFSYFVKIPKDQTNPFTEDANSKDIDDYVNDLNGFITQYETAVATNTVSQIDDLTVGKAYRLSSGEYLWMIKYNNEEVIVTTDQINSIRSLISRVEPYKEAFQEYQLSQYYVAPFKALLDGGWISKESITRKLYGATDNYENRKNEVDQIWSKLKDLGIITESFAGLEFSTITQDMNSSLKSELGIDFIDSSGTVLVAAIQVDYTGEDRPGLDLTYKINRGSTTDDDKMRITNGLNSEDNANLFNIDWNQFGLSSLETSSLKSMFYYNTPTSPATNAGGYYDDINNTFPLFGSSQSSYVYGLGIGAQAYYATTQTNYDVGDNSQFDSSSDTLFPTEYAVQYGTSGTIQGLTSQNAVDSALSKSRQMMTLVKDLQEVIVTSTSSSEKSAAIKLQATILESMPIVYQFIDQSITLNLLENGEYAGRIYNSDWKEGRDEEKYKYFNTPYQFVDISVEKLSMDASNMGDSGDQEMSDIGYLQGVTLNEEALYNYAYSIRSQLNKFLLLFHIINGALETLLYQARDIHDLALDSDTVNEVDKTRQNLDKMFSKFTRNLTAFQSSLNSGVDQLCDELISWCTTINQAIKQRKELDIDGWARSVVAENEISGFIQSFLFGGVTDLIDELSGGFTYARAKMKREANTFFTKIIGANTYRSVNFILLNLEGKNLNLTGTGDDVFVGGIKLFKGDPQTPAEISKITGVYTEGAVTKSTGNGIGELAYELQEFVDGVSTGVDINKVPELEYYGKNFLKNYLTQLTGTRELTFQGEKLRTVNKYNFNVGDNADLYEGIPVGTPVTAGLQGEIGGLLAKVLNVDDGGNGDFIENIVKSVTDNSISRSASYQMDYENLDTSRLYSLDLGTSPVDSTSIQNPFQGDAGSNPLGILMAILGISVIQQLITTMAKGIFSGLSGGEFIAKKVFLMYNSEKINEFRYRMYAFQVQLNLALIVQQMIAKARQEEARQFGRELGIKQTSSSSGVMSLSAQALEAEFMQIGKGLDLFSQNAASLNNAINETLQARIESFKSVYYIGLKLAKTVGLIALVAAARGIWVPLISSLYVQIPINPVAGAAAATGHLDPTYHHFAAGTLSSYTLELIYDTLKYTFESAMVVYKNPVSLIDNHGNQNRQIKTSSMILNQGNESQYSSGGISQMLAGNNYMKVQNNGYFGRIGGDVGGNEGILDFFNINNEEGQSNNANRLSTYAFGARNQFSRRINDWGWTNIGFGGTSRNVGRVTGFTKDAAFLANRGDGHFVQNGLTQAFANHIAKYQMIRLKNELLIIRAIADAMEQAMSEMWGKNKQNAYNKLDGASGFSAVNQLINIESQILGNFKQDLSALVGSWNQNVDVDKNITHEFWGFAKSSIQTALSVGAYFGTYNLGAIALGFAESALDGLNATARASFQFGGVHNYYHYASQASNRKKALIKSQNNEYGDFLNNIFAPTAGFGKVNEVKWDDFGDQYREGGLPSGEIKANVKTSETYKYMDELEIGILHSFSNYGGGDVPLNYESTETGIRAQRKNNVIIKNDFDPWLTAADGMNFKILNPLKVSELQESTTHLFTMRMIIMMLEQARYNAIQGQVSQITGMSSGANILQTTMEMVDLYNGITSDTIQSISEEWMSRVESINEKSQTEINLSIDLIMIPISGMIFFNQYIAFMDQALGPAEAQKMDAVQAAAYASMKKQFIQAVAKFISGLILLLGTLDTMDKLDAEFAEDKKDTSDDDEDNSNNQERDQLDPTNDVKQAEKEMSNSSPGFKDSISFSSRGTFVVNKAAMQKVKSKIKKQMRTIKILTKLKDKENAAKQDVAAEISGLQQSGAGGKLDSIIGAFQSSLLAKVDAIISGAEAIAKLSNQALEDVKGLIKTAITMAVEGLIQSDSKKQNQKLEELQDMKQINKPPKTKLQKAQKVIGEVLKAPIAPTQALAKIGKLMKQGVASLSDTKVGRSLNNVIGQVRDSMSNSKIGKALGIKSSASARTSRVRDQKEDFLAQNNKVQTTQNLAEMDSYMAPLISTIISDMIMKQSLLDSTGVEDKSEQEHEADAVEGGEDGHMPEDSSMAGESAMTAGFSETGDIESQTVLAQVLQANVEIKKALLQEDIQAQKEFSGELKKKYDKVFGKGAFGTMGELLEARQELLKGGDSPTLRKYESKLAQGFMGASAMAHLNKQKAAYSAFQNEKLAVFSSLGSSQQVLAALRGSSNAEQFATNLGTTVGAIADKIKNSGLFGQGKLASRSDSDASMVRQFMGLFQNDRSTSPLGLGGMARPNSVFSSASQGRLGDVADAFKNLVNDGRKGGLSKLVSGAGMAVSSILGLALSPLRLLAQGIGAGITGNRLNSI